MGNSSNIVLSRPDIKFGTTRRRTSLWGAYNTGLLCCPSNRTPLAIRITSFNSFEIMSVALLLNFDGKIA